MQRRAALKHGTAALEQGRAALELGRAASEHRRAALEHGRAEFTADICPVSTEDIYPVPTGVLLVEDNVFQNLKTNLASHGRREFGQATPRAELKTVAAT